VAVRFFCAPDLLIYGEDRKQEQSRSGPAGKQKQGGQKKLTTKSPGSETPASLAAVPVQSANDVKR
jgi:hypothetical protein